MASGKEGFDQGIDTNKAKMTPCGATRNFFSREIWVNSVCVCVCVFVGFPDSLASKESD